MKTRVTDPRDLLPGDQVGPWEFRRRDSEKDNTYTYGFKATAEPLDLERYWDWFMPQVVAELLKVYVVERDEPEPDTVIPADRIRAKGLVGDIYAFSGGNPGRWIYGHAKPGDTVIVVKGDASNG